MLLNCTKPSKTGSKYILTGICPTPMEIIFLIVFNLEQQYLVEKEVMYNKCNRNEKSYSNTRSDRCGT